MRRRLRKVVLWTCFSVALLIALLYGVISALSDPLPKATPGPKADALARRLAESSYPAGWHATGAIRWTFRGQRQHLWDRERQLISVRFEGHHVLRHLHTPDGGRVYTHGEEVFGSERDYLLDLAYAHWANDSFWLNPLEKLFDEGVIRGRVPLRTGGHGLLVTYQSGGVTPGDAYLWIPGEGGAPVSVRMWVSVIPIKGLPVSWERWETLATGARVATFHRFGWLFSLELTDIEAARSLLELTGGKDPFTSLFTP